MGIENMRRWPMYIVFAVCVLLTLSLFNTWSLEAELRNKVAEISTQLQECSRQLQECSKQQSTCRDESLTLRKEKEEYAFKVAELNQHKMKLSEDITDVKNTIAKTEIKVNRTGRNLELCKTELQSLKNVDISKTATLTALRDEVQTLTTRLTDRQEKITKLEKEIERLKSAITTKSAPNPPAPPKMTPAAQPIKMSPPLNLNPINEPENDAKEEMEDALLNDGNDFEQPLQ